MSSNGIIASLQQGNAFQLELIQQIRSGLNEVIDGMEQDCLNRRDDIDELSEQLQQASLSETADGNVPSTDNLEAIINTLSRDADKLSQLIEHRLQTRKKVAEDRFQAEMALIDKWAASNDALDILIDQVAATNDKLDDVQGVYYTVQAPLDSILEAAGNRIEENRRQIEEEKQCAMAKKIADVEKAREAYMGEGLAQQGLRTRLRKVKEELGLE